MTKWQAILEKAQKTILQHEPHPYYEERYMLEESAYWSHIPQWIAEQPRTDNMKCLDIGCAYGTLAIYTHYATRAEIYCTDCTDRYISKELIHAYGLKFATNNIELDEFPWDIQFDIIIFTEVLEHLNFHPDRTLHKIRSLLKPDGYLYLTTPDASQWGRTKYYKKLSDLPQPNKDHDIIDDHIYVYDEKELDDVLYHAGLHTLKSDYAPGSCGKRHFNRALASHRRK